MHCRHLFVMSDVIYVIVFVLLVGKCCVFVILWNSVCLGMQDKFQKNIMIIKWNQMGQSSSLSINWEEVPKIPELLVEM